MTNDPAAWAAWENRTGWPRGTRVRVKPASRFSPVHEGTIAEVTLRPGPRGMTHVLAQLAEDPTTWYTPANLEAVEPQASGEQA